MALDRSLVLQARRGSIEVAPEDVLGPGRFLFDAQFTNKPPTWLLGDLLDDGLTLYVNRSGRWILASLDE